MITRCQKCGLSHSDGAMGSVLPQCRCWLTNTPVAGQPIKDHEIARLVNELTEIARTYGQTQQLRERISQAVLAARQSL